MINIKNFFKKIAIKNWHAGKDGVRDIIILFILLIIEVIMICTIDGNTDIEVAIFAIYNTFLYFLAFFIFLYCKWR